ncbi:short-chain dehydrogenase [Pedobacter chinensis]|uniref:Short-chain dehydrogenase n=1 Tax=Pedobacter chinensis TaxID=2282421 RepID=A0A369PVB0_9SPHI|nr:SDR family oxidoreductase [Pedobacter chinensis]RDC56513.1 short-chain dehydrogenase [Pedobacter chinensis]
MSNSKTILITGAGSGLGEGTAIGLAQLNYKVIAGVQILPQVTALRKKVAELGLENNIEVIKLNILDKYDVKVALKYDIDILFNNAGIGESGPVFEMPLDIVRDNFETNVFAPLELTQQFVARWITAKKQGKVIFTSSVVGLFTQVGLGAYASSKHALEAIAESLAEELKPYNIKIQTINPGAYFTGFNETMAETAFRWLDDKKNITKRADLKAGFDAFFSSSYSKLDPAEMIDAMIKIIPSDTGKFRNAVPQLVEDMLKGVQLKSWENTI